MGDVVQLSERLEKVERSISVDPPGGGGDNGDMEARLTKIETIIPTLSTKEDLVREVGGLRSEMHKEFNTQTWRFITWMTGICTALIAATYFIVKH